MKEANQVYKIALPVLRVTYAVNSGLAQQGQGQFNIGIRMAMVPTEWREDKLCGTFLGARDIIGEVVVVEIFPDVLQPIQQVARLPHEILQGLAPRERCL
jgi:hypothetical protein